MAPWLRWQGNFLKIFLMSEITIPEGFCTDEARALSLKARRIMAEARRAKVATLWLRGMRNINKITEEIANASVCMRCRYNYVTPDCPQCKAMGHNPFAGVSATAIRKDVAALEQRWRDSQARDFNQHMNRVLEELYMVKQEAWEMFEFSKAQGGDPGWLAVVLKCIGEEVDLRRLKDGLEDTTSHDDSTPEQRQFAIRAVFARLGISTGGQVAREQVVIDGQVLVRAGDDFQGSGLETGSVAGGDTRELVPVYPHAGLPAERQVLDGECFGVDDCVTGTEQPDSAPLPNYPAVG
jgi:hypothetical protein